MISKVRATTKLKCVQLCIEKEKRGYECISKIKQVFIPYKQFKREKHGRHKYQGTDYDSYWEAVYRKGS
jgi:hypothetical protein